MSLYIYLIYKIYYLSCTCGDFYDLSAWGSCWFIVYIRRCKFINKLLNVGLFYYTAVAGNEKVGINCSIRISSSDIPYICCQFTLLHLEK